MKLKKMVLRMASTMVPLLLVKKLFFRYPSTLLGLIIEEKTKRLILSKSKKVLKILGNGKYIVVNESGNQYNSLNMCYINDMLGGGMLAIGLGYIPYFQVPYYINEREDGKRSIHEDFFEQKLCKERGNNLYIKAMGGCSYLDVYTEREIKIYAFLYKNLIVLNEKSKKYVENTYREIRSKVEGKLLGVCCRGTDFLTLKPKGHPIQPTVQQVLEKVQQYLMQYGYEKIYVTSEEYRIVKIFEDVFPNQILTNSKEYYDKLFYSNDSVTHISQIEFDRKNDRYIRGLEYFCSVYILSRCDAIIGGNCGATRSALYMNDLKYEKKFIFNLGLY